MTRRLSRTNPIRTVSRREALGRLAALTGGVVLVACTPLRIVMHLYPEDFDQQPELVDRILRAFAVTILPAAGRDDPNLVRAFYDEQYPLAKYACFLAADLCRRSYDRFGEDAFDELTAARRTTIVQDALAAGWTTTRLYTGAIFLAQIAFYGAIYDDENGCPAIGFEGRYRFRGIEATTYPNAERYLAQASTANGNPS